MPVLSTTMEEGTVAEWLKREGDAVARDEPLLMVEMDKGTLEVPAPASGVLRRIIISNIVASGVRDQQGILISGIPNYPIEDLRLSNIRIHYTGGGTRADAARDPEEKEKDYPEPDMFGRLPVYALFARHVAGLDVRDGDFSFDRDDARPAVQLRDVVRVDMDNIRAQKAGTTARELMKPIHLARAVKETF